MLDADVTSIFFLLVSGFEDVSLDDYLVDGVVKVHLLWLLDGGEDGRGRKVKTLSPSLLLSRLSLMSSRPDSLGGGGGGEKGGGNGGSGG